MRISTLDQFIIFFKPIPNLNDIPNFTKRLGTILDTLRLGFLKTKCKTFLDWQCIPIFVPMSITRKHLGSLSGSSAQLQEANYELPTLVKNDVTVKDGKNQTSKVNSKTKTPEKLLTTRVTANFSKSYTFEVQKSTSTELIVSVIEMLAIGNVLIAGQTELTTSQRMGIKAFIFDGFTVPDFLTVTDINISRTTDGAATVNLGLALPKVTGTNTEVTQEPPGFEVKEEKIPDTHIANTFIPKK